MNLKNGSTLHGFTITSSETIPEIDGIAYIGVHEPSGARLLYLANDDNNKSFAIGFRTPPADDTGVFHILEHSVLNGSKKFPVKEPFVDLLKGSMQTFLNAMTFPDKTLYPVASTNEQDLLNLMDVYLDAVFHPQIYNKRAIFEQEGWHYEWVSDNKSESIDITDDKSISADNQGEDQNCPLIYNGVVYNEMKGALSDPNSVLYDQIQSALFPDTCYAFESGGTPEAIPTLTYENYLDEHRRHYRTDNSYVILYGNMDIDRILKFIDEEYLSPVTAEQSQRDQKRKNAGEEALVPRTITKQSPLIAPFRQHTMDTAPENACAGCGYVIGDASEYKRIIATDILLDALFGSNEAPLKRVLLDRGIAHDIQASVADSIQQPFAFVQIQMPTENAAEMLPSILEEEVCKLLDAGLDKALIEAALSHGEFQLRESDFGIADGVLYAMRSLSSWLYDENSPLDYLRFEDVYHDLRQELQSDYFEKLLADIFCNNNHYCSIEILPTPGKTDDKTDAILKEKAASLSQTERQQIIDEEALLRKIQETPDTPEALATLPHLSITDIGEAPDVAPYELDESQEIPCLYHHVATRGISYAYRYFELDTLRFDELPYSAILALVLGKLDTAKHTAAQLDTLIQAKLGNLSFFADIYEGKLDPNVLNPKFVVCASALEENTAYLASIPKEVITETNFSDTSKILDILKQRKIALEQAFTTTGHSCAVARARSYYTKGGVVREQLGNVGFYTFLCDLIEHYDERSEELIEKLENLCQKLFCDNRCIVSFAGNENSYESFWSADPSCHQQNNDASILEVPNPKILNEAFIVPTDVCFGATGWDWRLMNIEFTGSWLVVSRALTYDYLWNEVRVKGGAYGVGFQAARSGNMHFYSFRDPHIDETFARFDEASQWLSHFAPTEEALEGFVVATVASLDAPTKARAMIRRQDMEYFTDRTS